MTTSPSGPRKFPTTRWHVVQQSSGSKASRASLTALCEQYWPPLYSYIRARGYDEDVAQDLIQGFFHRLLEKDVLTGYDRERGRFRTFMLAALKNFMANEWHAANAQKRGGGTEVLSLENHLGQIDQWLDQDNSQRTPEAVYEHQWALRVIDEARERLREEYAQENRTATFAVLSEFLEDFGGADQGYARAADALQIKPSSMKVTVHRIRRRLRKHVQDVVADTVDEPAEVAGEMTYLLDVLGRNY